MSLFEKLTHRLEDFVGEAFLPEEAKTLLRRASEAIEHGDFDRAIESLEEVERVYPDFYRTQYLIGLCQYERGEFEAARESFERALHLRPTAEAHYYAALVYAGLDDPKQSVRHLLDSFRRDTSQIDVYNGSLALARGWLELDEPERAESATRRALEIRATDDAYLLLVRSLYAQSNLREARRILDEQITRADTHPVYSLRGRILEKLESPRKALQCYKQALRLESDDADTLFRAGRLAALQDRRDQARYFLDRVMQSGATQIVIRAQCLLGAVESTAGALVRARQHYEAAVERDSECGPALAGLGQLSLLGDPDELGIDSEIDFFSRALEAVSGLSTPLLEFALRGIGERARTRDRIATSLFVSCFCRLIDESDARSSSESTLPYAESDNFVATWLSLAPPLEFEPPELDRATRAKSGSPADMPRRVSDRDQLLKVLGGLYAYTVSEPAVQSVAKDVAQYWAELARPPKVVIAGEFNAGKSALVNALVETDLVATGALPETKKIWFIRYGPEPIARIHFVDRSSRCVELQKLSDIDFESENRRIERICVEYPHPLLCQLTLVDTPGFNAADDSQLSLAGLVRRCEAVIWVVDANQPMSESQLEQIERIGDRSSRLMVVLNKIDRIVSRDGDLTGVETLLDRIREQLGDKFRAIRPISTERPTESDLETQIPGIESIREMCRQNVVQCAESLQFKAFERILNEQWLPELEDLSKTRDERLTRVKSQLAELGEWFEGCREHYLSNYPKRTSDRFFDAVEFVMEADKNLSLLFSSNYRGDSPRRDRVEAYVERLEQRLRDVFDRVFRQITVDTLEICRAIAARLDPIVKSLEADERRTVYRALEGYTCTVYEALSSLEIQFKKPLLQYFRGMAEQRISLSPDEFDEKPADFGRKLIRQSFLHRRKAIEPMVEDYYRRLFFNGFQFISRTRKGLESEFEIETRHTDISSLYELQIEAEDRD